MRNIIIIVFSVSALLVAGLFFVQSDMEQDSVDNSWVAQDTGTVDDGFIEPIQNNITRENNNSDCSALSIQYPTAGSSVNFPAKIQGKIDRTRGCQWTTQHGTAGTVELFFFDGSKWGSLAAEQPITVDDWTSQKFDFDVTVDFNNGGIGLPTGHQLKLVFTADNPSGLSDKEQVQEVVFQLGNASTNQGI